MKNILKYCLIAETNTLPDTRLWLRLIACGLLPSEGMLSAQLSGLDVEQKNRDVKLNISKRKENRTQ